VRPIAAQTTLSTPISARAVSASSFSTMSSLKSSAPPVASKREYDPEIKDIASYIHNTPVDSELAVWYLDLYVEIAANWRLA
jgi:2-methylcitrate dehydratase